MSSLREELGGRPVDPTPFSILCPPGWRRVPPASLAEESLAQPVLDALRAQGRPDLVLQLRSMLARYRRSVKESRAFDAWLAPLVDDGVPMPATLLVSPLVLPSGSAWNAALSRMSKGAQVDLADFTETSMWMWRRDERMADEAAVMVGRATHYIVPTPEADARRALHFQFTVLVADDPEATAMIEPLETVGDLMMSTFMWRTETAPARTS